MPVTVAVLLIALGAEPHRSLTPLPHDVVSAMARVRISPGDTGFEIPGAVPPDHLVRGDFDGNGHEDWAVVVGGPTRAAILVAYRFSDEWRSGNIDVWGGPECQYCSQGPRPIGVGLLPPGKHAQLPGHGGPLLVNERARISSQHPGVCVTLADGRRRAYYLGEHAWVFVDLGPQR